MEDFQNFVNSGFFKNIVKNLKKDPETQLERASALSQYIKAGIPLLPTYPIKDDPDGFYMLKQGDERVKLTTIDELNFFLLQGFQRFIFIPKESGLIAIDIDKKKGVDGFKNFITFLHSKSIFFPLFDDIENGSFFPCVKTPNGGMHLYTKKSFFDLAKVKKDICEGVEIKHTSNITAGGSMKNGRFYELEGTLDYIPTLPSYIQKLLFESIQTPPKKVYTSALPSFKTGRKRTPSELYNIVKTDHPDSTPHDFILYLGGRLQREGYTYEETLRYTLETPDHQARKDIKDTYTCIASLYK